MQQPKKIIELFKGCNQKTYKTISFSMNSIPKTFNKLKKTDGF